MTLPNFLIIGAAKSGTTSLYYYCQQHPDIFMSNTKEPNFFYCKGKPIPPNCGPPKSNMLIARHYKNSVNDLKVYQNLFSKVGSAKVIGEASVRYLYFPRAAENIKQYVPNVKMAVVLRNPIDRLYSQYLMNMRHCFEPLSLVDAIAQEKQRIQNNWGIDWHYVSAGMYYEQLMVYRQLFQPEQLKIILFDDLIHETVKTVQDLYQYLEIDSSFIPDISVKLAGYLPKNQALQYFLLYENIVKSTFKTLLPTKMYKRMMKSLKETNKATPPSLPSETRKYLQVLFREDMLRLQDLLQRELPWLRDQ